MSERFDLGGRKLSEWYQAYMKSRAWWLKRTQKLKEQPRCEKCRSRDGLIVHHKTYERFGDESLSDLQVLCNTCHFLEHASISACLESFFGEKAAGGGRYLVDEESDKERKRREMKSRSAQ